MVVGFVAALKIFKATMQTTAHHYLLRGFAKNATRGSTKRLANIKNLAFE